MYKRYKDMVIGGVLVALSGIYLMMSFQIKLTNIDRIVGSRLFPQICGVLILILSFYLMINSVRTAKFAQGETEKKSYKKTVLVVSCYAAYIYLMDKIGFAAASVLYLFSQMVLMGKLPVTKKNVLLYSAISVLASVAVYLLFNKLFMLMLPKAGWL